MDAARAEALVGSCVPSKRQWGYRNKLELSCGADGAGRLILGMRPEGGADVVSLDACPWPTGTSKVPPRRLGARYATSPAAATWACSAWGCAAACAPVMWRSPCGRPRSLPAAAAAKTLASALKNTSVVRVVADPGRAAKVKKVEAISGKGCWEEEVAESRLLLSAPSFAQVNTAQAEKLVELVLAGLEVEAGDYVADLYAGAGTFTLPLARPGPRWWPWSRRAAPCAICAATPSAPAPTSTLSAGMPPGASRAGGVGRVRGGSAARGAREGVVASIAAASPRRVAYVSCDASTWARDAARFEQEGYRLIRATPVDLFPQTYHVEVVSIFERSGS